MDQVHLKGDNPKLNRIVNRALQLGIAVQSVPRKSLQRKVKTEHFQHIILKCSSLDVLRFDSENDKSIIEESNGLWLMLDGITDPQNFGAILRNAFFLVNSKGGKGSHTRKKELLPIISSC